MIKHLFQRTLVKNGKKIKAWYYWYYDKDGKQVRKSCGKNGKPCLLKREAEQFLENIKSYEKDDVLTFNEYCDGFYNEDSIFIKKQSARGYEYQAQTIYQKKLFLSKFLDRFGTLNVNDLSTGALEKWLINLDCSNSVKNNILSVVNEIEEELYSERIIDSILHTRRFKRNTVGKGIITIAEIKMLFPDDYEQLIKIWRVKPTESERDVFSFATMIYTILSTGMRSSEIRALQWNQFVQPDAILINAMIDSNNQRVNRLKKWTENNKKWRVTVLPDKTVKMINYLKLDKADDLYVFMFNGKIVESYFLNKHFKIILRKMNIDCKARNITIHSLRFTYNTIVRGEIADSDLRLMLGHTNQKMTDYYDKTTALEHLDTLMQNKPMINSIFN